MRAGARELPRGPGAGDMFLAEVIHRANRKAAIREIVFA
jgi:hypothetical protein